MLRYLSQDEMLEINGGQQDGSNRKYTLKEKVLVKKKQTRDKVYYTVYRLSGNKKLAEKVADKVIDKTFGF